MKDKNYPQSQISEINPFPVVLRVKATNRLLFLAIFLLALIPLLITPVLPLIDFYNHIARYFVLSHIDLIPVLSQNYAANWVILPNIGLDVLITGLMLFVPTYLAPHITIILIFAVQYGGILYFSSALTGRVSVVTALLTVPLLYSFILNWGFANFLLGMGLVFWGAGWWLQQRRRVPNQMLLTLPVACLLAVVIFFVHGVAFALYGLLLGALEIGLFRESPSQKLGEFFRAMAALLLQAVVPVTLFLSSRISAVSGGVSNADESASRLSRTGQLGQRIWELIDYRLTTIVRVAEGPSFLFDILTLSAMLGLVLVLVWRGRLRVVPVVWPALLLAGLLIVAVPPTMFGIGYISDRMPLFGAFLLVAGLQPILRGDRHERWVLAAMTALVGVRLLAIGAGWHAYGQDRLDFAAVASRLPPGQLVETIVVGGGRLDTVNRRCQMFGPLLVAEHGAISRLFAGAASQPIIIRGPLLAAIESTPRDQMNQLKINVSAYDDWVAAVSRSKFPWLLLCDASRLKRPLPAGLETVAAKGRFTLLRVTSAAGNN